MPFCARWWLILSREPPPKRTVYFPAWCLSLKRWVLHTPCWGPDWNAKSRGSSSATQVRAAACTALPWASTLSSTKRFLKHSSEHYPALQHRAFHTSSKGLEHESAGQLRTSGWLWPGCFTDEFVQCFLKATDPKRGHTKLPIKSIRWALLWLLSFTVASHLFLCTCCISGREMLNSSLCFLCQTAVTMLLWSHTFLHKSAPYSIHAFCKKITKFF